MSTRHLQLGALCDPISKQLDGIISLDDSDQLDRDNEAITRCYLMGYMPESVTHRARTKLIKKCQVAVDRFSTSNDTRQ